MCLKISAKCQPFYSGLDVLINSLWPSDAIWQHPSGSTLAQIMACCLMATSHYLNQCWLIIKGVLWHSPETNVTRCAYELNLQHLFEALLKLLPLLLKENELINRLSAWNPVTSMELHFVALNHQVQVFYFPKQHLVYTFIIALKTMQCLRNYIITSAFCWC